MKSTLGFCAKPMKTPRLGWIAILAILSIRTVAAGVNEWTNIGPFNATDVVALAIDPQNPQNAFAGTASGIFRTADGGAHWHNVNAVIFAFAIAIDPQTPNIVYVGGPGGLSKSTDGGLTWSPSSSGVPQNSVSSLAIDPQNPQTIYAGTGSGIYKSIDAGASWNFSGSGLPTVGNRSAQIISVAIDPQDPNRIFTGLFAPFIMNGQTTCCITAVFKSADGGTSWTDSGLGGGHGYFGFLAVDPQNHAVYAGTSNGFFKSANAGGSWQRLGTSLFITAVTVDQQGSVYFSDAFDHAVFESTNGGASWTGSAPTLDSCCEIQSLAVDPKGSGTIYTGGAGLSKSTDDGASWATVTNGLSTLEIHALAFDPQDSSTLYAGTVWSYPKDGLFKGGDGGASWTFLNNSAFPDYITGIDAVAIDPHDPLTIYVATDTSDAGTAAQVYKSIDGGNTWNLASFGLPSGVSYWISALAIDPDSSNLYATTSRGLFETRDGAATWFPTAPEAQGGSAYAIAFDPQTLGTIYEATLTGLFKTSDSGASWINISSGPLANNPVTLLALAPQTSNTLYAVAGRSVFRSTDSGATWNVTALALPSNLSIQAIAVDFQHPSTLYVSTSGGSYDGFGYGDLGDGVFKSTDAGATWFPVEDGLTSHHATSLLIDARNSNHVYVGTIGGGVFDILFTAPALLSSSGDGQGQGAILHANTPNLASADNPAAAGEPLEIYCTGLADGGTAAPQVTVGGQLADILYFGPAPGLPGINQVNISVPAGVAPGSAIPVQMNYLGSPSNEVTIAVQQ